jgi:hypothetical protein
MEELIATIISHPNIEYLVHEHENIIIAAGDYHVIVSHNDDGSVHIEAKHLDTDETALTHLLQPIHTIDSDTL